MYNTWEQRKFDELSQLYRGLTYKPSDVRKDGIRVLRSSNIDGNTFTIKNDDVFVKPDVVKISTAQKNDILITAANGSSSLVGKHALIDDSSELMVHGGFMLLAKPREPEFTNALMNSQWYRNFIFKFVAGGNGAIGNLKKSDLENQNILIPSSREQKQMGRLFSQLDNLITLHQRKDDFYHGEKLSLHKFFHK
ncbi:restriction endonuclease subunit S [Fructobacillus americanaquae]|uniref:Restriction endonuclease subunit S n=1 Tax=Fructobacillus americanaquae TaxID=2940302 RepID=A0ABY5C2K5_9LACO|nr:restriction endonuclease subunit S [Fructobacillus americanaquae]USS92666.1 restriction endonuclease subunit S [Fructobacillus americanaquae]